MEIIKGRITDWMEDGTVVIRATLPSLDIALKRQYSEVQIGMDDGRRISPEQRRKIYSMIREIADWMGDYPESVKRFFKMDFVLNRMQAMERKMFSLSTVDMTTAREFIEFLIEFIISHDVPCREPLWRLQDDSGKYVYSCLVNKKCCVCGQAAQLHHCDRVGMGNNRDKVQHIGREALPLCGEHHSEIHNAPEAEFYERYHLRPVKIDNDIARKYNLTTKGGRGNDVD
jgi:hypothetical protein